MISNLVELEFRILSGISAISVCKGDKVIALLDPEDSDLTVDSYVMYLIRTTYKSSNKRLHKELVRTEDEKMFSFYYGYKEVDVNNEHFQAYLKAKIGGVI